ncbi:MAG: TetR/AcrR family transcriptional regulator [FCB group bacterium]|nr:TetR/AcrR family transcriptional regulator [FCB group bacterium]
MDRDEKRKRIVEIAGNFISRFGWQKTTMEGIAGKAKMAKSSLYYYFQNKEDIYQAVIERDSRMLRQKVWADISEVTSPTDKLSAYINARMTALQRLSNYYSTLTDEFLDKYSFVRYEREKFKLFEENTIHHILTEGCIKGIFKIENMQKTCDSIIMAIKGMEPILVLRKNFPRGDSIVENMLNLLFNGIRYKK